MFQNIAMDFFSLHFFILLCYAMFQNIAVKISFSLCYMRYVSKHSLQNCIFFVFLYVAMLFAVLQNIAVKISFSLYFFILLCYAMFQNTSAKKFDILCFSLF